MALRHGDRKNPFNMKIGEIELRDRPLFLAPMEDVTDASFRFVCKEGNMGRFLLVFTAVNVAFLGCGLALRALLGGF